MRSCALVAIGWLALIGSGCGGGSYVELGLVPVSGTVTLDGRPLSGAKVSFEGEDKRQAIGVSNSAGQYELMYDSRTAGATPGTKTVRITAADVGVEGGGVAEGTTLVNESIPTRYNVESELKADVSPGNKTFHFNLKSRP